MKFRLTNYKELARAIQNVENLQEWKDDVSEIIETRLFYFVQFLKCYKCAR